MSSTRSEWRLRASIDSDGIPLMPDDLTPAEQATHYAIYNPFTTPPAEARSQEDQGEATGDEPLAQVHQCYPHDEPMQREAQTRKPVRNSRRRPSIGCLQRLLVLALLLTLAVALWFGALGHLYAQLTIAATRVPQTTPAVHQLVTPGAHASSSTPSAAPQPANAYSGQVTITNPGSEDVTGVVELSGERCSGTVCVGGEAGWPCAQLDGQATPGGYDQLTIGPNSTLTLTCVVDTRGLSNVQIPAHAFQSQESGGSLTGTLFIDNPAAFLPVQA